METVTKRGVASSTIDKIYLKAKWLLETKIEFPSNRSINNYKHTCTKPDSQIREAITDRTECRERQLETSKPAFSNGEC